MSKMEDSASKMVRGAQFILVANVTQRLFTFALNQILLRWTTPEVIGQASIQLELLLSTMLFLSREGIRLVCLRETVANNNDRAALVNISWFPSIALFLLGSIAMLWQRDTKNYTSILLYWGGACMESIGEPWFNVFQNALVLEARLKAEMFAVFVRCVVAFVCVGWMQWSLVGFGCAQFAYGLAYLGMMVAHMSSSGIRTDNGSPLGFSDFLPSRLSYKPDEASKYYFSFVGRSTVHSSAALLLSSLVKHCLTEADRIVLTFSASHYDQGIYAVTNNYGSLVARTIFLPLEETSRLIFSKEVAALRLLYTSGRSDKATLQQQSQSALVTMKTKLVQLLRLVSVIAIFFPVFGFAYSELAVSMLFSRQWRTVETVNTLSYYCFYIFFLAINGVSESFVQSSFPASTIGAQSLGLLLSSVAFVGTAVPAIQHLGTSGLVIANSVGMAIRIGYNLVLIHRMFSRSDRFLDGPVEGTVAPLSTASPLRDLLPSAWTIASVVVSFLLAMWSAQRYHASSLTIKDALLHVAVGGAGAIALLLLIVLVLCPREDVLHFKQLLLRRKAQEGKKED